MKKNNLLKLKPAQLLTHARNMRRFYPAEQVREMANSILAAKGVIEPLIVIKESRGHKWLVIDGNMRLAGARLLGEKSPSLDCKVIDCTEADQLLSMTITNQVRYDIDPVSEGLHYKALQKEGLSTRDISKRTGVYEIRISNRKILADLEEPIQKLIISGKLPADPRVARALLRLTPAVRIKLATHLSENPNIKIATILNACERLLEDRNPKKRLKHPASGLSGVVRAGDKTTSAKDIRAAAKAMCKKCNQVEDKLGVGDEPSWSMLAHAADDTCSDCDLREMQRICACCPAVQLLRTILAMKESTNGR
jgi:ParB/RepB/Spo0J family partition protein